MPHRSDSRTGPRASLITISRRYKPSAPAKRSRSRERLSNFVRLRTELAIMMPRAYVKFIIDRGSLPAGVDG
jgi:hypothetical protein